MEVNFNKVNYNNIHNLDLKFKENEIVSLIGKNNSGKTTILNLIYGLSTVQSGEVKIGKNVINNNTKEKRLIEIRKDISYLIDDYKDQLFNINILEDIKYNLECLDEKRLNELLKLFYLDKEILNKSYTELSNGEKKKILLVSIILKNSKVILLDNPNSGLDYRSIQNLVKILRKEKRNGKIIIITSENSDFLLQVSDRIIVLDQYKVLLDDEKYKVFTNYELLSKINVKVPKVVDFESKVKTMKEIKLGYRDNISDLLKDIYRYAK